MFATKEEVIYVLDSQNCRVLRFNPAESFEPVVVGQVPAEHEPKLYGTCLLPKAEQSMWLTSIRERCWPSVQVTQLSLEVLECPGGSRPTAILIQEQIIVCEHGGARQGPLRIRVAPRASAGVKNKCCHAIGGPGTARHDPVSTDQNGCWAEGLKQRLGARKDFQ